MIRLIESKKNIIAAGVLLVTIILLTVYILSDSPFYLMTPLNGDNDGITLAGPQDEISQVLTIPRSAEGISGIKIEVGTNGRINEGKLILTLYEDGSPIYEWERKTVDLLDREQLIFKTEREIPIDPDSQYMISVRNEYEKPWNDVIIVMSQTSDTTEDTFLNGETIEGKDLFYSLICTQRSVTQRVILSLIILISVLILTMTVFTIGIDQNKHKFKRIIWYACAICIMFLSILIFGSVDGVNITDWAFYFLEAIRQGEWRNYALFLKDNNIPTNYGVVGNFINAVSLLPLYIIGRLRNWEYHVINYNTFRGISSIICVFITALFIKKVLKKMGFGEEISDISAVLYMISPAVVWGNISHGQIDVFCVLFLVIAAYFLVCEKMPLAVLFIMISAEFKPFSLMFAAVPLFILMIGQVKPKVYIECILMGLIPPVISRILSGFVFVNYSSSKKISERSYSHILRFFEGDVGTNAIFFVLLMLILFWCIFRVIKKEVRSSDYLIVPMAIIFAFQVTVFHNMQWFVYSLLAIILASLYLSDKRIGLVIYVLFSMLFLGFAMSYVVGLTDNGMIEYGLMADLLGYDTKTVMIAAIFDKILAQVAIRDINYAVYGGLTACSIALFYEFIKAKNQGCIPDKEKYCEGKGHYIALIMTMAIDIAAIMISVLLYFGLIWV